VRTRKTTLGAGAKWDAKASGLITGRARALNAMRVVAEKSEGHLVGARRLPYPDRSCRGRARPGAELLEDDQGRVVEQHVPRGPTRMVEVPPAI
jgi:hypothetical protein